jgi:hypothetical protein
MPVIIRDRIDIDTNFKYLEDAAPGEPLVLVARLVQQAADYHLEMDGRTLEIYADSYVSLGGEIRNNGRDSPDAAKGQFFPNRVGSAVDWPALGLPGPNGPNGSKAEDGTPAGAVHVAAETIQGLRVIALGGLAGKSGDGADAGEGGSVRIRVRGAPRSA